ncbi:MAG TPA: AMIN domain-containing protein, partial [Nitrospirota bacterium]
MKHTQPHKAGWLIILITLIAALQGCAARAPETYEEEEGGAPVHITKIEPRDAEGKTEIQIEGSAPLRQYTSFQLTDPLRLVVDISSADIGAFKDKIGVNSGAVIDITPSQKDNIARLEIALAQAVDAKVSQADGRLVVEVPKPAPAEAAKTAPEAAAPAPQQEAPKEEKAEAPQPTGPAATVVSSVRASAGKEGVKVVITGDGAMRPNTFMAEGKKLVVDIPGARSTVRPSVIPVRKGGLVRVRVGQHPAPDQKVRVVLDLAKPLEYSVVPEGNTLIIAMSPLTSSKPEV